MAEETIINCLGCGKELYRGDGDPPLGWWINGQYCANCTADNEAEEEWEASLADRFLADQYDQQIRAEEELRRK